MKNVFFAAFFGAACCLSGCRQEAATPATGEHYAFAEEMFRKVWDMYRVPEYGLFSEYYPNSYRPDVNYFDDGAKSTQEVSFLWPMDGVFTSAVALARGALAVYPVQDPESGRAVRDALEPAVAVGAVAGGAPVPGFDFGNSPSALARADLSGKNVVLSTAAALVVGLIQHGLVTDEDEAVRRGLARFKALASAAGVSVTPEHETRAASVIAEAATAAGQVALKDAARQLF